MARDESCPRLNSLAVHELRSPASVISGYLRMLQRDTEAPLTDRQRKMVEEAEKSCGRLVALIADLSEVGKIDEGVVTMSRRKTDVFRLVNEMDPFTVLLSTSGQQRFASRSRRGRARRHC
jgi:signal transduction histidine kinase